MLIGGTAKRWDPVYTWRAFGEAESGWPDTPWPTHGANKHCFPIYNQHRLRRCRRAQILRICANTPRVGLEPTTLRLTAECSTIELSRNGPIFDRAGGAPFERVR